MDILIKIDRYTQEINHNHSIPAVQTQPWTLCPNHCGET